jgi:hypothetical protein
MKNNLLELSSEQTLRLKELRDALDEALPVNVGPSAQFPVAHNIPVCMECWENCWGTCISSCAAACGTNCWWTCAEWCREECNWSCVVIGKR